MLRRGEAKTAYASAALSAMRGNPRIATDHLPVASGADKANTPRAINKTPVMRFRDALEDGDTMNLLAANKFAVFVVLPEAMQRMKQVRLDGNQ